MNLRLADLRMKFLRELNQTRLHRMNEELLNNHILLPLDSVPTPKSTTKTQDPQSTDSEDRVFNLPLMTYYQTGCPGCGGQNFEVELFGDRHLCGKCKDRLRGINGGRVEILKEGESLYTYEVIKEPRNGEKGIIRRIARNEMFLDDWRCTCELSAKGFVVVSFF